MNGIFKIFIDRTKKILRKAIVSMNCPNMQLAGGNAAASLLMIELYSFDLLIKKLKMDLNKIITICMEILDTHFWLERRQGICLYVVI